MSELDLAPSKMKAVKSLDLDRIQPEFLINLKVKARNTILAFLYKVWRNPYLMRMVRSRNNSYSKER